MGRASSLYTKLPAQIQRLEGLRWQAYKKFRAGSSQVARIDSAINDLKAQQSSLMTRLMGPGPMLRFANWLRVNPLGRLFRIPLKGFAASSLIDQLHALDMPLPDWYQGWMPPMAQYLWEIKGVLFEMGVDHVFMPAWKSLAFNANTVEVFKFTQEEWISERAFMNRLVGPGYENYNIIRTRFLPDGMVNVEIGEFKPFFKNISNVFSNANQWLRNFKAWDIKLSRTAPATWVRNVLNPGLIMGWEIGVMMGLPWYGIIATSLGGSMLYGLGSWGAWRLASALNLITEGFGSFFGRINTFGMVGWGVGIVADIAGLHTVSFLGYTLSSQLFFTGLGVGVGLAWPSIVAFANGVALTSWGAAIGSSLGGTFASLGITAATTAVLSTIIAVGSVALLTIFIVFVVGSAFWVPLQEITEGVGVESACFRVTPDTQNLILKNGEDKQICAIIDNKNQQYPGKDIYTSFYFNPPDNFQWTNGQYTIMDMAGVPISLPSKSVPLYETGAGRVIGAQITMELPPTPPDQTKQQLANQVAEIQNKSASLQAQGFTKDQASTILLAQQYINGDFYAHQVDVYKQQLAALNTIQQQKATKDFTEYKNNIKNILNPNKVKTDIITQLNYDSAAVIQSDPRAIYLAGLVNTCQKNPTAKDCEELNKEIDQLITNAQTQSDQFFNQVENYTKNGGAVPLDFLSDTKNQLDTVIKQGDFVKGEYETQGQLAFDASQVKQGNSVDNILNNSKYNTQSFTLNSQQFRACINVKYVGKDNEEASVSVKNQASAPMLLFGALGALTPLCSAQSQINFNTAPQKPGSLSDPIKGPQCSTQTFDPKTHTGVDITNASNEASSCGESIYPAKEGTIVSEGFDNTNPQKTNKGNYVIIDHGSGLYSLYAHMGNSINYQFPKQIGDSVGINDIIGQVGSTGNSTGCHLHLGVVSGEQQGLTGTPLLPRFNSSTTVDPCLYFSCPTSCQTP